MIAHQPLSTQSESVSTPLVPHLYDGVTPGTASPVVTLIGVCPRCGYDLRVAQTKAGKAYLRCQDPRCEFRAPYDPVLQQLRDRNARLEAELALLRMQLTPQSTSPRPVLPRWVEVAQRQAARSHTALAQAMGAALARQGGQA